MTDSLALKRVATDVGRQSADAKAYVKPDLKKGPRLGNVTASKVSLKF